MAKKDWKAKVEKDYPEFVDAVVGLSVAQLDERLLAYAKESEAIANSREEKIGELLRALADQKKTLEGPYKDAATANALKRRYIVKLIGEKGGNDGSHG